MPKRLMAVTVSYGYHSSRHLASAGQWLGVGRAPWKGGGVPPPPSNASLPGALVPPGVGAPSLGGSLGLGGGGGMVWYGMPYGIGSGWRAAPSRSPCLGPGSGASLP